LVQFTVLGGTDEKAPPYKIRRTGTRSSTSTAGPPAHRPVELARVIGICAICVIYPATEGQTKIVGDSAELVIKKYRRNIVLLFISIVVIIGVELDFKARGLGIYFPPQLFWLAILTDLYCIALFLWFIRRTKARKLQSQASQKTSNNE